jgi:probable O-glycosylation ligase (exosortase A-associated)
LRATIVFLTILGSLPYTVLYPWIGVLTFSWISYMNPHKYAWGIVRTFPVALIVAVITIAGMYVTKDRAKLPKDLALRLIVCLWVLFVITTLFAINQADAWAQLNKVSKILLMTFVTIKLINNPFKLRILLLVIAFSVGLVGLKGAIWAITSGGVNRVYGPDGSFLADNNDLALALNMTLPLMLYLSKDEPRPWLRSGLKICFVGSIIAVIFTYSRGGFLALVLVGFMLLIKARYKALAMITLFVGVIALAFIVPQKWTDRMDTIKQSEDQDASAHGRVNAWRAAINIASHRPLTGGGFQVFVPWIFERYAPEPWNYHDVHSNYFEMLGEHGFIGLGLYMMLLFYSLITASTLKWRIRREPKLLWAQHFPDMLQVAILAYMLGGIFLGRAYFDLYYHLVASIVILKSLVLQQVGTVAATVKMPARISSYAHPAAALLNRPAPRRA